MIVISQTKMNPPILTFSIRETYILAKQGKVGTSGVNVIRGQANTCKSSTWNTPKEKKNNKSDLENVQKHFIFLQKAGFYEENASKEGETLTLYLII